MGTTSLPVSTPKNRRVVLEPLPSARYLSLAAVAIILGQGETTVWHMTKSGVLPTVLIGRRRLIPRAALEAYEATLIANGSGFPKPVR